MTSSLIEKFLALGTSPLTRKARRWVPLDEVIATVRQHESEVVIENDRVCIAGKWFVPAAGNGDPVAAETDPPQPTPAPSSFPIAGSTLDLDFKRGKQFGAEIPASGAGGLSLDPGVLPVRIRDRVRPASGVVQVCPDCDIAECMHTRDSREAKQAATQQQVEAAFQSALKKFGDPDDQFGAWHLDEGGLRTLVYDAIAAMPKAPPVQVEESKPNRSELLSIVFDAIWKRSTLGMTTHAAETATDSAVSALLEHFEIRRKT